MLKMHPLNFDGAEDVDRNEDTLYNTTANIQAIFILTEAFTCTIVSHIL